MVPRCSAPSRASLAALGGSAALDGACAPRGLARVDGDSLRGRSRYAAFSTGRRFKVLRKGQGGNRPKPNERTIQYRCAGAWFTLRWRLHTGLFMAESSVHSAGPSQTEPRTGQPSGLDPSNASKVSKSRGQDVADCCFGYAKPPGRRRHATRLKVRLDCRAPRDLDRPPSGVCSSLKFSDDGVKVLAKQRLEVFDVHAAHRRTLPVAAVDDPPYTSGFWVKLACIGVRENAKRNGVVDRIDHGVSHPRLMRSTHRRPLDSVQHGADLED